MAARMAVTGWRVGLGVGAPQYEPTDWRSLSVDLRLSDACEASLAFDGHSFAAEEVVELASDLWVWLDTDLVFRGRIIGCEDSLDQQSHTTTVRATDYRGLLQRRVLLDGDQAVFAQRPQAEIAWTLVNATQLRPGGALGITRGLIPQTQLRDRTFDIGSVTGDLINALAEVIDGFDWQVDESLRLNVFYPRRGGTADLTLEYGAAVTTVDRTCGSDAYSNVVRVIGAQGTVAKTITTPTIVSDQRGRWESAVADPDLILQSTVNDRASRLLADRSDMRDTFTVQLAPGAYRRKAIAPGDVATFVVRSGRLDVAEMVRVSEIAVDVDASGGQAVKLALVCEPGQMQVNPLLTDHPDLQPSGGQPSWP